MLVAYNGVGYFGLQKNPDVLTIEETLEKALHAAGGISDANLGKLQNISWKRAGRTDKGVHAVGQLISAKLVLTPDGLLERANAALAGSNIAILGMERTTNNFCAHTLCSSREYEYLLPTSVLRQPADGDDGGGGGGASLTDTELEKLRALLSVFKGTHAFHNFTDGRLAPTDGQAKRYILSATAGAVLTLGCKPYVPIRFHGQSFLLHQIRKMVAMVTMAFRGNVPENAISTALQPQRLSTVPMAPSCALYLKLCHYTKYEKYRGPRRGSVHFPQCEAAQRAFVEEHILPHIASCEADGEFERFGTAITAYQIGPPRVSLAADGAATAEDHVDAEDEADPRAAARCPHSADSVGGG